MFQTTNQLFTYTYKYHLEKYEFVSWDDDIPNIWKNKKCSKPPNQKWLLAMGTHQLRSPG